jgi:hypothetical protein
MRTQIQFRLGGEQQQKVAEKYIQKLLKAVLTVLQRLQLLVPYIGNQKKLA